jgi:hypothetical protein
MFVEEATTRIFETLDLPAAPLEGLVAGHGQAVVSDLAVCSVPSMAILKRAASIGCNLILCDSHPFYLYDRVWSTQISNPETVLRSSVAMAKRAFIEHHRLHIVRLHTAWEKKMPQSASLALAEQLGLIPSETHSDYVHASIQPTTMRDFGALLARRGGQGLRLIGSPSTQASRIAVKAGLLAPDVLARVLRDPTIDIVIAGDAVEWEGVPYMEDAIAAGRKAALILTGFDASMEPVGAHIASWARTLFPDKTVAWLSEPNLVHSAD